MKKISKSNIQGIFRRVFYVNMLLVIVLVIFKDVVLKVNGIETFAIVIDKQYGGYKNGNALTVYRFSYKNEMYYGDTYYSYEKAGKAIKVVFWKQNPKINKFVSDD